jgi:hypothetical protein
MKYKLDLSQPVHQLPGEPLVSECYEHITETSPSLSSTIIVNFVLTWIKFERIQKFKCPVYTISNFLMVDIKSKCFVSE